RLGRFWSMRHQPGLNCNLFNADFPASFLKASRPSQIAYANLRIFMSEVRADFRSVPVNARSTVSRMSEGVLPVAKVGTREGKTFTRHGRGSDFQGLGILQH